MRILDPGTRDARNPYCRMTQENMQSTKRTALHVARSGASSGSSNAILDAAPEASVHKKNTVTSRCITGTLAAETGRIASSPCSQGLRRCANLRHETWSCKRAKENIRKVARVCEQCGRTKRVASPEFSERAQCSQHHPAASNALTRRTSS